MKTKKVSKLFTKKESPSQRWPTLRAFVLGRVSAARRFLHLQVGSVALIITIFLWQALAADEGAQIQRQTELEAASVKIELANQMQQRIQALVWLGKRWENSAKPSQKQWEAEAALYIQHWSGYLAIESVDSELNTGSIVPPPASQAAENLNPALAAQGRQALLSERSRRQEVTVTDSVNLAQGGKGILVCVPIFSEAPQCTDATCRVSTAGVRGRALSPKSVIQNPKSPDGYILGVFRTQELLDGILNQNIRRGYAISIFDGEREIYRSNRAGKPNPKWVGEEKVEFYGATWRVRVMPAPELVALEQSRLPEVVLAAGIAVTVLLALAVYLAQTAQFSRKQLEEIVACGNQEALRQSEERFRNLVETASDWVWEVDANGVYTYTNPKVRDLLGFQPEEVLGKTPFDLMPPEEAFRAANIWGPIVAQQQLFSCLENTNLHKDGRLVVLETSGVPVFDSEGKFLGYRGINRDITQRVRVLEALRQSEEIYRLLVEGVKDCAIFMLDPSGHVVSWNRGAERIKGYRA